VTKGSAQGRGHGQPLNKREEVKLGFRAEPGFDTLHAKPDEPEPEIYLRVTTGRAQLLHEEQRPLAGVVEYAEIVLVEEGG
jgi:hypothetical protein